MVALENLATSENSAPTPHPPRQGVHSMYMTNTFGIKTLLGLKSEELGEIPSKT